MARDYQRTEQDNAIAIANMQQLINTYGLFAHPQEYRKNMYEGKKGLGTMAAFIPIPHAQGGILKSEMLNVINDFMEVTGMNPTPGNPASPSETHSLEQNGDFSTLTFTDAGVKKLAEANISSPVLDILSGKVAGKWSAGL